MNNPINLGDDLEYDPDRAAEVCGLWLTDQSFWHSWNCALMKYAATTRCWPNAGLMFAHRLRRWVNIIPPFGQRIVFAGIV